MNRLYAIILLVTSLTLIGCGGHVPVKNYDYNTPGAGAGHVITSANETLMKTLSKDGEGYEVMDGNCKVVENTNGKAWYRCTATTAAGSNTFGEKQFPPAQKGDLYDGPYRNDRHNNRNRGRNDNGRQCRRYDRNGRCLDRRSTRTHSVSVRAGASVGSGAYIRD